MYRVIVSNKVVNAATVASRLEKEYNSICRQLEEIQWDSELARREGFYGAKSQDTTRLESRQVELHNRLLDMWRHNPSSVSKRLQLEFAEEEGM